MNIYESINAILKDVPAIGKNQKNQQQGFMYRGIDVVMNHLQPLFAKYKVFCVPEVINHIREERITKKHRDGVEYESRLLYSICTIKYTFYAEDGTSVSATVIGEGMDSGDKATNKAMAIAFKYACFQVFCIPTEEMKDPDAETPPESFPKPASDIKCQECGALILPFKNKGVVITPEETAAKSEKAYGKVMCVICARKAGAE